MRLDLILSQIYHLSRNKAQQLIKNGLVLVSGRVEKKPSYEWNPDESLEIKADKSITWVSRSAGKLDGFLEELGVLQYAIQILGADCLDIGSSTGGFTQILLERGANHVDAVDVGSDQLHASLRDNDKISLYEKTDIREFAKIHGIRYDIIVCDVSFISLEDIFPAIKKLSDTHTNIFVLYKPQFEVGRENLRKTGVPKEAKIIEKSLIRFRTFLNQEGYSLQYESKASVVGEAGNQEYMFFLKQIPSKK